MEFDWEENKRKANLRNHGIDFVGIDEVLKARRSQCWMTGSITENSVS